MAIQSQGGIEKRRHKRIEDSIQVHFQFVEPPSSMRHLGKIEAVTGNISEGGIYIHLNRQEKLKDDPASIFALLKCPLSIEIHLEKIGNPVKAIGKAVWVEKKVPGQEDQYSRGVAVQFTKIGPEDTKALRIYVASASTPA